jgi:hypothetical protein
MFVVGRVATRPGGKKPGRSCLNGYGISGSNWAITWNRRLCAPPSLLPPSHRRASRLPDIHPRQLLSPDTVHRPRPHPGKRGVSPEPTFLVSPMARSGVRLANTCSRMNGAVKPMEACAWCMEPASAVAVPVLCANSVSGMAARPQSHARSACCSIRSRWVPPRSCGEIGAAQNTGAPACSSCAINVLRCACRLHRHLPPLRPPMWT